jgi:hypothetical protein
MVLLPQHPLDENELFGVQLSLFGVVGAAAFQKAHEVFL